MNNTIDCNNKIQCAACGYIGDEKLFDWGELGRRYRICPKCGTVRLVTNENKNFQIIDSIKKGKENL